MATLILFITQIPLLHMLRLLSLPFYMCGQLKRFVQAVHAGDAPPFQP